MEDLPIIPNQWKLKVKSEVAKQFKIIRELIGKATEIVNAGDPDRGATCSVMKSYCVA